MNWVGGARSRLNRKNEKKIQQQFFEEKRKAKQMGTTSQFSSQCNSLNLSQDLLSFKRLSNAYSSKPLLANRPHKKARFVDLDSTKPRSRFIKIKEDNQSFDKDLKPSVLQLSEEDNRDFRMEESSKEVPKFYKKNSLEQKEEEEENSSEKDKSSIFLSESVIEVQDTVYKNIHLDIEVIRKQAAEVSKSEKEEILHLPKQMVYDNPQFESSEEKTAVKNLRKLEASKDFFNLFDCWFLILFEIVFWFGYCL